MNDTIKSEGRTQVPPITKFYKHGADEPKTKVIKVSNGKSSIIDITLLDPEELRTILESFHDFEYQNALFGLEIIAEDLRTIRNLGPIELENPQINPKQKQKSSMVMEKVSIRQLLYSDAIYPVVLSSSLLSENNSRTQDEDTMVRVRPGKRKTVYTNLEDKKLIKMAVASEQAIDVEGIVIHPEYQGQILIDMLAGGVRSELSTIMSVMLARYMSCTCKHLISPLLVPYDVETMKDIKDIPCGHYAYIKHKPYAYSHDLINKLRRQFGAELSYHLSGAGIATTLDYINNLRKATPPPSFAKGILSYVQSSGIKLPADEIIRSFIKKIAQIFPSITDSPEEFMFALNPLTDLLRADAYSMYYFALTEKETEVNNFINKIIVRQDEAHQHKKIEKELFMEIAQARQYMIIIEDKFGSKKLNKMHETLELIGPSAMDNPKIIISNLDKREREIVLTEYKNRHYEWEAQINNNCPHVKLTYGLRTARTAKKTLEILKNLQTYFKTKKSNNPMLEWILCKNCGFRIICPHVVEYIRMKAKNISYDIIRARLMKYSSRQSLHSENNNSKNKNVYFYFCKICSEKLSEFNREDRTADILGSVGNLDGYIKKIIWMEAVNSTDYINFPSLINPRNFAKTAIDICYPLLLKSKGKLFKSKKIDEENIEPLPHLYIIIYVYAYILNLIRSSHETSKDINNQIGFEGVTPNSKMSRYAKVILSTITNNYSGLISRIEDITTDFIADRFREAYRSVIGENGDQELTTANEAKIVINEITTLSPIYRYITNVAKVFKELPIHRAKNPSEAKLEFETVFGRTLPDILNDNVNETKSELVQKLLGIRPTGKGTRKVVVEYPRDSDPLYIYGDPEVNFLKDIFKLAKPSHSVDMKPFEKIKDLAKSIPVYLPHDENLAILGGKAEKKQKFLRGNETINSIHSGLFLKSYKLFTEYVTSITSMEDMKAYQNKLHNVRIGESGYLLLRAVHALKNFKQFGFSVTRRFKMDKEMPITYLYDEQGKLHSWTNKSDSRNIFIYRQRNGETIEMTRSDIIKKIDEYHKEGLNYSPNHDKELVNIRCGKCNILFSEIHTLDEEKTFNSLQALSEFEAFYSFYNSRCPVEGLHDFTNSDYICSKCGITKSLIFGYEQSENVDESRTYYDKYKKKYYEHRKTATGSTDILHISQNISDPTKNAIRKHSKFVNNWKYNYSIVVKAAEITNSPVSVLENLGATEKRDYSEILDGVNTPTLPKVNSDPRLNAADSSVRIFITAYNRLRFVSRFSKTNLETDDILHEAEVPKHRYNELEKILPDVVDDYSSKRLAFIHLRTPGEVLLFTIESLARMAVELHTLKEKNIKWLPRLGKIFAHKILAEIIKGEKLFAKNGPFNWNIFGDRDSYNITQTDKAGINNMTKPTESDDMTESDEKPFNPFSLDEVDISEEDTTNLE